MPDNNINKWLPIETLPDRGLEIVEIKMSGGEIGRAPGIAWEGIPREVKASMAAQGHWPDHKSFTPTHWRRLPPEERRYVDEGPIPRGTGK